MKCSAIDKDRALLDDRLLPRGSVMWKAFFVALGITLCILGVECLVLDKAILKKQKTETVAACAQSLFRPQESTPDPKELKPEDWHPWSLLSSGAVIILYSFSIPRRNS